MGPLSQRNFMINATLYIHTRKRTIMHENLKNIPKRIVKNVILIGVWQSFGEFYKFLFFFFTLVQKMFGPKNQFLVISQKCNF